MSGHGDVPRKRVEIVTGRVVDVAWLLLRVPRL